MQEREARQAVEPAGFRGHSAQREPVLRRFEARHARDHSIREDAEGGERLEGSRSSEGFAELGEAIGSGNVTPEELAHLRESTTRLVEALHQQHDEGVLAAARERLEGVAAGLEARAPNVAGITRRLLDTLSNLGI